MTPGRIKIEIIDGDGPARKVEFDDEVIEIGKLANSTLQLKDENVSRRHAKILVEADGRVALVDHGSTNGTRLNGMLVQRAYVADGDEIEIGVTRLRVRLNDDLKRTAAARAPSARTGISHEGFYTTEEAAPKRGKLALEGALLWEDSPVQVEAFRRSRIPVRLKALLILGYWLGPLEMAAAAGIMSLVGFPLTTWIGVAAAGLGLAIYFVLDHDGWRNLGTTAWTNLTQGEAVFAGETADCKFFAPSEAIGAKRYRLLVPHRRGWALNLENPEIKGDVLLEGKVRTLDEVRTPKYLKGKTLPIQAGMKFRLRLGQFSMLLSYVAVPPKPRGGFLSMLDARELVPLGVSLIMHFGLLILFVWAQPRTDPQLLRERHSMVARTYDFNLERPEDKKKEEKDEEKKEEEDPEKVDLADSEKEDVDFTTMVVNKEKFAEPTKDEDMPTKKAAPVEKKRHEKKERPRPESKLTRTDQKRLNKERARRTASYMMGDTLSDLRRSGITRNHAPSRIVIGGGGGPAGPAGDPGDFGDPGARPGGAFPSMGGHDGGDDLGGITGPGGGRPGDPKGGYVAGLGKDAKGGDGKRFKKVGFSGAKVKAIVAAGAVTVAGGSLTRAIIKKYINRQKGSVIRCYKRAIQSKPKLEGKVVVSFVIAPSGQVMGPKIRSSSLGDATVHSCITRALAIWRFPKPEGGGAARVSYPFLFRTR